MHEPDSLFDRELLSELDLLGHLQSGARKAASNPHGRAITASPFYPGRYTRPGMGSQAGDVDLWHDRALLHFLTEAPDCDANMAGLRSVLKAGGSLVIEAFPLEGVSRCSYLPVRIHSTEILEDLVGDDFQLEVSLIYLYMPDGDTRLYIYTRFRRVQWGEN